MFLPCLQEDNQPGRVAGRPAAAAPRTAEMLPLCRTMRFANRAEEMNVDKDAAREAVKSRTTVAGRPRTSSRMERVMAFPKTIKLVSFEESISNSPVMNTVEAMGRALIAECDPANPAYQKAAESLLAFQEDKIGPEQERADLIAIMTAAGIFIRKVSRS